MTYIQEKKKNRKLFHLLGKTRMTHNRKKKDDLRLGGSAGAAFAFNGAQNEGEDERD